MVCSSKPGPALFVGFINESFGEKVSQHEWHAIRMLTEAEQGKPLSRARAGKVVTESMAGYLASAAGLESDSPEVNELQKKLTETDNTDGTLRAVGYLYRHGVRETLAKVRAAKNVPAVKQFAVSIEGADNSFSRLNYVVENESALAELVGGVSKSASVKVSSFDGSGVYTDMSDTEIMDAVDRGSLESRERNMVIPEVTTYSVDMEAVGPDGRTQRWTGHIESLDKLKAHVAGSTGVTRVNVTENRSGYTLGEPDRRQTQMVDLSDSEVKNLLEPDVE